MIVRFIPFILIAIALCGCGDPPHVDTPTGRRIISLSPAMTETIFALGLGADVVGVSTFCRQPEAVRVARESGRVTVVGGLLDPAIETILKLKPTLIFAEKTTMSGKLDALRGRGFELVELRNQTFDDAMSVISTIGNKLGKTSEADAIVTRIRAALEKPVAGPSPRVLLVYHADEPSLALCVGPANYQSDILTRLGGLNVLADETLVSPPLNAEHILQRDPDLVIEMNETVPIFPALERWGKLPLLRAVKLGEIHGIYGHESGSTGPSLEIFIQCIREILEGWQQRQSARS